MSIAAETKNLTFAYSKGMPDEKIAVEDISVAIDKGEFLGIIGHTGSGKSTFIQQLNGLLKPTSGSVFIDGEDIWVHKDKLQEYRFKVGLVFQYPEYQLFEETVYKDIAFGPRNKLESKAVSEQQKKDRKARSKTQKLERKEREISRKDANEREIKERVLEAAGFVGLSGEILERSPFDLSGGQKRRAAIAGVLAMQPEILVLDEPTAGLDPVGREEILGEIKRYHHEMGTTVILVSHSMNDIARYANKVMVINEGRLFCYDAADKVFSMAGELEKMGLAIPTVTGIMLGLKERGFDVDTAVYTVEDAARVLLKVLGKGGEARA